MKSFCSCSICNNQIEFECDKDGDIILCPYCNSEVKLKVPYGVIKSINSDNTLIKLPIAHKLTVLKPSSKTIFLEIIGILCLFLFPIGTIIGIFILIDNNKNKDNVYWHCSNCGNVIDDYKISICSKCKHHLL